MWEMEVQFHTLLNQALVISPLLLHRLSRSKNHSGSGGKEKIIWILGGESPSSSSYASG